MNKARFIGACMAAALLMPAAGFAADGKTREFVKDSVITTKIKTEMAKEKPSTLLKVSVDTEKTGVVVLGGTAKSQVDKDRAEAVARSVKGVTSVENNIEVKL